MSERVGCSPIAHTRPVRVHNREGSSAGDPNIAADMGIALGYGQDLGIALRTLENDRPPEL